MKNVKHSVLEIIINNKLEIISIEYINSTLLNFEISKGDSVSNWFESEYKEKFNDYFTSNNYTDCIQVEIKNKKYKLQIKTIKDNEYCLTLSFNSYLQIAAVLNKLSFQLLDLSEDGIIIVDQLGRIIYVNKAFCKLTKYDNESLIGKMFYPLFVNSEQYYKNLTLSSYQDFIISLDGTTIPVSILSNQIKYDNNQIINVYVVKNVSLLKKAEIQLNLRDQIIESIYFTSKQFLCSDKWDENINATLENLGQSINACKIKLFENYLKNEEELCMKLYAEWVNEDFKSFNFSTPSIIPYFPLHEDIFIELSKGNVYFIDNEEKNNFYRLQSFNQSTILIPINVKKHWWGVLCVEVSQPLKIWNQPEVHALKQISNIIGAAILQHRMIEKQQQLTEISEKSNLLKTIFLSNIGHEFRTPLNAIIGFSELIKKSNVLQEKFDEYLQHILNNSYRLLKQIDNLVEFSTLESGNYVLNTENINIQQLLTEIAYYTQKKILKLGKNITVQINCPDDKWEIITDRKKISKMFEQLTDNAVKFTQKGSIEIGCRKKENIYQFFIIDTGIGIEEKYHKIILNEFIQIEKETTRINYGLGMGLAIVNKIVKILNGSISLQSALNEGTTFIVELPDKIIVSEQKEQITNFHSDTVLVYDEDDELYTKLYSLLKQKYENVQRIKSLDNLPNLKHKCLIVNTTNSIVKSEVKLLQSKYPNLKIVQHQFTKNISKSLNTPENYWNVFCKIKNLK